MEDQYDLPYNTPHCLCSCRDKYNQLTPIARKYKIFYEKLKEKEAYQVLNDMEIKRMCCRSKFLSIPVEHMINRSKERYFNHEKMNIVTYDTRELFPLVQPPDFPLLPI